jgi:hypothetical protein
MTVTPLDQIAGCVDRARAGDDTAIDELGELLARHVLPVVLTEDVGRMALDRILERDTDTLVTIREQIDDELARRARGD